MNHVWKAGIFFTLLLTAWPAMAADEAVLRELRAMREEMSKLQKEVSVLKTELSQAKARETGAVKVSMVPAPKFETSDGEYSFKVGGFAQVDAGVFNDDRRDHPDGVNVRRARLSASGNITKDFKYKIENDFANNGSTLTDVYLEYVGLAPASIMVGQFKEPFGLETLTSDLFTTFIERALPAAFSPDRRIGVAISGYGDSAIGKWTATGGFFGSATSSPTTTDDEAKDYTARLTLAPFADKGEVLHFGVAGSHRVPDAGADSFRFQSRPETSLTSSTAVGGRSLSVDTGTISGVDDVNLVGLEASGVYGPFSLQGEYVTADVNRMTLADVSFDSYYVEASYFLTGESRNYNAKQAKFDRVTPNDPFSFSKGGWGAWQVAARLSEMDLTDGPVLGGEMQDLTFGIRWYPQAHVGVLANYIRVNTDSNGVVANDDPEIWMLRTQFDF